MKSIKELLGLSEAKKKKMKGEDPCWDNYEMVGTKKKNGKEVPNCVPKNEEVEIYEAKVGDTVSFHHELKAAPGTKMKKSGTVEKVENDTVHVKVKDRYGVKRHQVKMSDLVKEDVELEEVWRVEKSEATGRHHIVQGYNDKRKVWKNKTGAGDFNSESDAKKKAEELNSVKENFGADFLAMARQKNPNARLVTPEQKKKEAEELAKKRAGLKPAHAASTSNPRPLGGYDPKSNRSYSEEVETAAQVVKHFEKGQSTPSGVPKWVAEPLKKKKKVQEAGDPEMMGGAVSRPTASGNNPKLADKFMKAFRKMKSPANISCKTVGMTSTCEDTEQEFNNMFTEAMKKKPETNSKQNLKKGEKLSGKQEPITISPEIEKKGVA
jgi:hypothetical protein